MIAVWGRICKTKAIAVKDQKRKDVKSLARKKNSGRHFRGREERLQILKRMAEKTEEAEPHNLVFTFFKSMAQTVTQLPPSILQKHMWKFVSWLRKWKQKLYMSKTRRELRVFLFTVFLLLHLFTKCPVIPVTVKFRQHSEINPTRCNNCVYSSQWLYSTCFGWQFHPSSGVQCCIWPFR